MRVPYYIWKNIFIVFYGIVKKFYIFVMNIKTKQNETTKTIKLLYSYFLLIIPIVYYMANIKSSNN